MKSKRIAITIAEAGIVIFVVCGFYFVNNKQVAPTTVWKFNKNIAVNTQIKDDDLSKAIIPKKAITKDFILKKEDAVGKYVNTQVFADEYAIKPNVVEKKDTNPLNSLNLSKYRKISLPINYVDGLGGEIKAGDVVDLVYIGKSTKQANNSQNEFTYAKTFMQEIVVENVTTEDGEQYTSKSDKEDKVDEGKNLNTGSNGGALSTVVLAVTADQAEEILARLQTGKVRVVGRFSDSTSYNTQGFTYGNSDKVSTSASNPELKK